jgi:hypothetical protein
MKRRFAVILLAATAVAAVFVIPAHASGKSTFSAHRSSVRALRAPVAAGPRSGPAAIAWHNVASMPVGVGETGGGTAGGGRFFVPGGYTNTGLNDTIQQYTVASNTWANVTSDPLPFGQWADAAICIDPATKYVHIVNGVDGFSLFSGHQVYNPAAPAGSRMSTAPNPATGADGNFYSQDSGCAFLGGKMYLFGGYGLTDANPTATTVTLTWVFDPVANTWSDTGKNMVQGRLWMAYSNTASAAYAAGGNDLAFISKNSTERFSPAGGWTAMGNMPAALSGAGMSNLGTRILVYGGDTCSGSCSVQSNKTYTCTGACTAWGNANLNMSTTTAFFAWGTGGGVFAGGGFDAGFNSLTAAQKIP